ncbi:hypothetical protein N0V91_007329 [Didymella pomorum]|uniref:Uncharacterized protein n=1 Tax=Didymella pomorum TaxID=749634 RepID=A0A9W9D6K5_9PLEO|nr:hypothetical protein N0V91_007329 [Didymella pomorum]
MPELARRSVEREEPKMEGPWGRDLEEWDYGVRDDEDANELRGWLELGADVEAIWFRTVGRCGELLY